MAFHIPRLRKGCCCFSLKTGSLIIGYVSMVLSILVMSLASFLIYDVVVFVRKNQIAFNPQHSPEELAKVALGIYVTQAYYILVYLCLFIINAVMVIGIHKERPRLLRIYVYVGCFLLGMESALFLVSIVFIGTLASLPLLKWCVIHFYCLLVVRSTYMEMEDRYKQQDHEMRIIVPNPQQLPYNSQQAPLIK